MDYFSQSQSADRNPHQTIDARSCEECAGHQLICTLSRSDGRRCVDAFGVHDENQSFCSPDHNAKHTSSISRTASFCADRSAGSLSPLLRRCLSVSVTPLCDASNDSTPLGFPPRCRWSVSGRATADRPVTGRRGKRSTRNKHT